jgi:hypothetical protein
MLKPVGPCSAELEVGFSLLFWSGGGSQPLCWMVETLAKPNNLPVVIGE